MSEKIMLSIAVCIYSLSTTLIPHQESSLQQDLDKIPPRELVILYAKTKMDLAQVECDWGKEQPVGVVPKPRLERRFAELAVAKEQYNQAILASSGGLEKIRLCHAEEKVRLAKLDFEAGQELRKKDSISKFGLRRLELKYQIAMLDLALRKNPENYVTVMEAMQAQIDRQGQELLALDLRITALESVNTRIR